MTQDELKKLRRYHGALREMQAILMDETARGVLVISQQFFNTVSRQIYEVMGVFPGLLPTWIEGDHFLETDSEGKWYTIQSLRAYVGSGLAALDSELADDEQRPIITRLTFSFIADQKIRDILQRDYMELQRAFIADCFKASILLAGGAIEAILLAVLEPKATQARNSQKAPKNKSDIGKWDLTDLINVAVDLNVVGAGVEKLSHSVREYRNLIHLGNEVRNKLVFGKEEARIAIEVVHLLSRELSKP